MDLELNEAVELYNSIVKSVLDLHCPITTLRTKRRPKSPWYNEELREIKRLKRKYERLKKKKTHSCQQ